MQPTQSLNRQELHALEVKLSDLAAKWRGHKDRPEAETIVRDYQATLRQMIELGFRDALDVDSELPDRLMPEEYLNLFKRI
jgi:hypothetical protein